MKNHYLFLFLLIFNCSSNDEIPKQAIDDAIWCIDETDVAGGLSAFPIMDEPVFSTVNEIDNWNRLHENSKVALIKEDNIIFAFPYDFTNYYEVINFSVNNKNLALSYCPITESAICYNRTASNNETYVLKASGFLYKENMVFSDVDSNFYWSQMTREGLRSFSKNINFNTVNVVETTWLNVKTYFQSALVFNHNNSNICVDCNGGELDIDLINLFGIIGQSGNNEIVNLFNFSEFTNTNRSKYVFVTGKNTIVVGNDTKVFMNAFYIPSSLTIALLDNNEYPNIMTDNEGNKWDVFGYATEGSRIGERLESPRSYFAAEWAWETLFTSLIYR